MMKILIAILLQVVAVQLSAQFTFFQPKNAFAIEVSLEESALPRLPAYRNAISSLVISGDNIIGGTTADAGLTPFIFTASLEKREMTGHYELDKILKGQRSIRAGFWKGKPSRYYTGTLANKNDKGENQSGHLLEVIVDTNGVREIKDLGPVIEGEGIFSLTIDNKSGVLYGISYPTGIFFTYAIATKAIKTFRNIVPSAKELQTLSEYVLEPEDYLCKALVVSAEGLVFGSYPLNKLFSFDPLKQQFRTYEDIMPTIWGHRVLGQVESWIKAKDGMLYGGNGADGQLFQLNPFKKTIKNLGKPVIMPGIRGLAFGRDGKLYGIAGGSPGYSHLFSYSDKDGFKDFGNPQFIMKAPGIEQGIDWRGFQLGTITSSADGKYMVIGEAESLSQLLVFIVENPKK